MSASQNVPYGKCPECGALPSQPHADMCSRSVADEWPRRAVILLSGWGGRSEQQVLVVGETPKRYRIKATRRTKLAGRSRWIGTGDTALVPKHAVRFAP